MKRMKRLLLASSALFFIVLLSLAVRADLFGQQSSAPSPASVSGTGRVDLLGSKNWTTEQDHQNMMDQLGIKALRPGFSGNENDANHANYDESKANPFPDLLDALALKSGKKVATAQMWWKQRCSEIVEEFASEVVGRVLKNVPAVTWSVASSETVVVASHPIVKQHFVGHVDNSSYLFINVDLQ